MIDVEALATQTRESPPCGLNLEHDLAFFEIETAARGKPEQRSGDAVNAGEEPRWPKVVELAQTFLSRSKDLRIAVLLTRALVRTEGIPGLPAGLHLIHELLERYWDQVHPIPEAEAGNDPTERLNALAPLADPDVLVRDLRDCYLVTSRGHAHIQAREVEVALGRLARVQAASSEATRPLDEIHRQIAAAFADDRTVPDALLHARDHAVAIQKIVAERVGPMGALDLKALVQPIETLAEVCEAALGTAATSAPARTAVDSGAAAPAPAAAGEIRTRQDALRLLDQVCAFLERTEPSHPAPLFIRRAQRLMRKDFVEIMKDLLPESLKQLDQLAGGLDKKDA